MKTREQIIKAIKSGKGSKCLDGRDFSRLCNYFSVEDWETFGFNLLDDVEPPQPKELTKENILNDLKGDLEFAFEKALNCRGISSLFMFEVVKMWLWVLNDDLSDFDEYAMYGLPLYKAVALKYGFENRIGDDAGSEDKYEE